MYNNSLPRFALINRMNPEHINELQAYRHKYPNVGAELFNQLENNISWCDLKYNTVCTLNDIFRCGYGPTGVSELFEYVTR